MEEKNIKIDSTNMGYVVFGKGKETLIIVPGLNESLIPIRKLATLLQKQLKDFTSRFRIFVFSRRENLPPGFSTRDMADDLYRTLSILEFESYSMLGLSQGGMISQYFAIDHSQSLKKLIIAVSLSKPNTTSKEVFENWHQLAIQGKYSALIRDTFKKTCPSGYCEWFKLLSNQLAFFGSPSSLTRFIIQLEACINHNSHLELERIKTPTMIIGGMKDVTVGKQAASLMVEKIPFAILKEYHSLGHDPLSHQAVLNDLYHFLRDKN